MLSRGELGKEWEGRDTLLVHLQFSIELKKKLICKFIHEVLELR